MTRFSRTDQWVIAALLALALAIPVANLAGKGKPVTEPPPPPTFPAHPTLEYQLSLIELPNNANSWSTTAWDINNAGCAIGNYFNVDELTSSWLFDPNLNSNQAIELQSLFNVAVPDGAEVLARGLNDHGLIVGGILYADGGVDGFVFDRNTGEWTFLPTDPDWNWVAGVKVNNNGDILARFRRNDGTLGNYLYHPASEGVAETLEVINVNISANESRLNLAADGETTVVVGVVNDTAELFVHPKGGPTLFNTPLNGTSRPQINDSGTIFGETWETVEVQVSKRKTETVQVPRFFRDTDAGGTEILRDATPVFFCRDMNNSEVVVGYHQETINANDGTHNWYYVLTHIKGVGVVDIGASMNAADKPIWDEVALNGGITSGLAINDSGDLGAGQIVGATFSGKIFVATPVIAL